MPGPILRLKTGTESATPSVNGIIARNLVRLGTLLEDDEYRMLARQTCRAFSVEILQHPFLFVGLLDAVVGFETGTRQVTGVYTTGDSTTNTTKESPTKEANEERTSSSSSSSPASQGQIIKTPVSAREMVATQTRREAGLTT